MEHILRESKELQLDDNKFKAPKQIITDPEELAEYRLRKRKAFEDTARRTGRFNMSIWNSVSAHACARVCVRAWAATRTGLCAPVCAQVAAQELSPVPQRSDSVVLACLHSEQDVHRRGQGPTS